MILIDTHERKSLEVLFTKFPDALQTPLAIGDVLNTEKRVLIELKIEDDVHDYARMGDELTRMNLPDYAEYVKHLIYISIQQQWPREYKVVVGMCCKANVYPHHLSRLAELPMKLQELFEDHYFKPLQISQNHSKALGQLGQILATFRGISDDMAGEIEKDYNDSAVPSLFASANRQMGLNKDGSSKKVVQDMVVFLEKLKEGLI